MSTLLSMILVVIWMPWVSGFHIPQKPSTVYTVEDVTVDPDFAYDVAAKCKGEADFAIPECACTVYNRLEAGWDVRYVLDAYYANPRVPYPAEVWMVTQVLGEGCDLPLYYMFGKQDFWLPGIKWITPYCYLEKGNRGVYFYEQDYQYREAPVTGGVCGETSANV